MSFFDELKRRNVFKVGIAYTVTAWLLIQVTDILLDSIGAPPWVMQTMFVLLGVGFVIAVFFAWAFELTPEGVKREKDVDRSQSITPKTGRKLDFTIIGILVLALGYFVVDKFWLTPSSVSQKQEIAENTVATADEPQTIAVLPFVDMSPDGDNEYFSDGLTEELLNFLAKIHELQVAGRTSSFAFKGKDEDLRSIGEKLGVDNILEGSVRKDDTRNRVRITAQLINVENGFHLWSETYDRDLEDIFAIQEEIAREVAQALRITLLGEDEVRIAEVSVTDLSAYELYLQGLKSFNDYSYASLERAEQEFSQSIQLDPLYRPAQIKLVNTWLELTETGARSVKEVMPKAKRLLEQIMLEDPGNSGAHALLARAYRFEDKPEAAEQEFLSALDNNPRNVYALTELGRLLFDTGRVTRGLEYLQEAVRIDPYSVNVLWNMAMVHSFMTEPEKTALYTDRIGEIQPQNPMRYYGNTIAQKISGSVAKALVSEMKAIELDPNDHELVAGVAMSWAALGDIEQAEIWAKKADAMAADQAVPIMARMMIYLLREQTGLAADLAQRALERELDNRQGSEGEFIGVWISSLVKEGKIDEALAYYNNEIPQAFAAQLDVGTDSNVDAIGLIEVAMLLNMQDPDSERAKELLNAAELNLAAIDGRRFSAFYKTELAALAVARGDKATALELFNSVPDHKFGARWRPIFGNWFVFQPLHDEPKFKQLVAILEQDMEQQRQQAYEMLGINK